MIILNDWSEESSKGIVCLCTPSINSDCRISVLAARENCLFEAKSVRIFGISKLVPDLVGEVFGKQRAVVMSL